MSAPCLQWTLRPSCGRLCAMARWPLRPNASRLRRRCQNIGAKALFGEPHARTPEITANLQAAFEMFLEYAISARAITTPERDRLADRCWDALCEAAAAQAAHQGETEPTARFLSIVRSVFSSGRAHLASR